MLPLGQSAGAALQALPPWESCARPGKKARRPCRRRHLNEGVEATNVTSSYHSSIMRLPGGRRSASDSRLTCKEPHHRRVVEAVGGSSPTGPILDSPQFHLQLPTPYFDMSLPLPQCKTSICASTTKALAGRTSLLSRQLPQNPLPASGARQAQRSSHELRRGAVQPLPHQQPQARLLHASASTHSRCLPVR